MPGLLAEILEGESIPALDRLRRRAVADPAWWWEAWTGRLAPFHRPPDRIVSGVGPDAVWFPGATLNAADVAIRGGAWPGAGVGERALVVESESGDVWTWTRRGLAAETARWAQHLHNRGVRPGDGVGLWLPMSADAVFAFLAVVRLGAIAVPLFSAFGVDAARSRLDGADARVFVATESTVRRGRASRRDAVLTLAETTDAAVLDRPGGRAPEPAAGPPLDVVSSAPFMVAYTSGTTGGPRGVVHVHGGFPIKVAEEVALQLDCGPGTTLAWVTDPGWVMFPWKVLGALAVGATVAIIEGDPLYPADRLPRTVENLGITHLGISPSLARALRARRVDRWPTMAATASTGEPWDTESWAWWRVTTRRPIVNLSGGTEVGTNLLSPHLGYDTDDQAPCELGGPSIGLDVTIDRGELCCRNDWPGRAVGYWPPRTEQDAFRGRYWPEHGRLWRHGDAARVDSHGRWYIDGRVDDVMNIAGKRLGPGEVEDVVRTVPGVEDVAAYGARVGGGTERLYVAIVGAATDTAVEAAVVESLGAPFRPTVRRVAAIPRTPSGKTQRRLLGEAEGRDAGDADA